MVSKNSRDTTRIYNGSITVFLSILLLLILSIILTTIEASRVQGFYASSQRMLMIALNSTFSKYYGPLYDNYHIFGLHIGDEEGHGKEDKIVESIDEYIGYNRNITAGLDKSIYSFVGYDWIYNEFSLYGINNKSTKLLHSNRLTHNGGTSYRDQSIAYMKSTGWITFAESLYEKFIEINKGTKVVSAYKEQETLNNSVLELEESILKLMNHMDGFPITKSGISTNYKEEVDVLSSFVKKFYPGAPSFTTSNINNSWIYGSIYPHYVNSVQSIESEIQLSQSIQLINSTLSKQSTQWYHLSLIDQSKLSRKERSKIKKEMKELEESIDLLMESRTSQLTSFRELHADYKDLVSGTLDSINTCITILHSMGIAENKVLDEYRKYQEYLDSTKEMLGDNVYDQIRLEIQQWIEEYLGFDLLHIGKIDNKEIENGGIKNEEDIYIKHEKKYKDMKNTLEQNKNLLLEIKTSLDRIGSLNISTVNPTLDNELNHIKKLSARYSFSNLELDYSKISRTQKKDNILSSIQSFIDSGILGIAIEDENTISRKNLTSNHLPSEYMNLNEEKEESSNNNLGNDSWKKLDEMNLELPWGNNLEEYSSVITDKILYASYINTHFSNRNHVQLDKERINEIETYALDYEMEYILYGDKQDKTNLSKTLQSMCFIRTILNYSTILLDQNSHKKAYELALTLVGFTGMPMLIHMTKYSILLVQAMIESIFDLINILKGQKVFLIKRPIDLSVDTFDILKVNKTWLHTKSKNKVEDKGLTFGYDDYILLLLTIQEEQTVSSRSLDLIQENIRNTYIDNFYIQNIITDASVGTTFTLPKKFIKFPFLMEQLKTDENAYEYSIKQNFIY